MNAKTASRIAESARIRLEKRMVKKEVKTLSSKIRRVARKGDSCLEYDFLFDASIESLRKKGFLVSAPDPFEEDKASEEKRLPRHTIHW